MASTRQGSVSLTANSVRYGLVSFGDKLDVWIAATPIMSFRRCRLASSKYLPAQGFDCV